MSLIIKLTGNYHRELLVVLSLQYRYHARQGKAVSATSYVGMCNLLLNTP